MFCPRQARWHAQYYALHTRRTTFWIQRLAFTPLNYHHSTITAAGLVQTPCYPFAITHCVIRCRSRIANSLRCQRWFAVATPFTRTRCVHYLFWTGRWTTGCTPALPTRVPHLPTVGSAILHHHTAARHGCPATFVAGCLLFST